VVHELHTKDRQAINETLSLHGHLFDEGHLDRLGEIFTPDAVYDMNSARHLDADNPSPIT
jgi:hypothetical protein